MGTLEKELTMVSTAAWRGIQAGIRVWELELYQCKGINFPNNHKILEDFIEIQRRHKLAEIFFAVWRTNKGLCGLQTCRNREAAGL